MLKVIMEVVSYLLLSGRWAFTWTVTENPDLMRILTNSIKDGQLTNKEVGLILKEIEKEM